jgi:hypothetical protein
VRCISHCITLSTAAKLPAVPVLPREDACQWGGGAARSGGVVYPGKQAQHPASQNCHAKLGCLVPIAWRCLAARGAPPSQPAAPTAPRCPPPPCRACTGCLSTTTGVWPHGTGTTPTTTHPWPQVRGLGSVVMRFFVCRKWGPVRHACCACCLIASSRLPPSHYRLTQLPPPPAAADLTNLPSIRVNFTLGKRFLPYEQLLAVQPSSRWAAGGRWCGGRQAGRQHRSICSRGTS